MNGNDRVKPDLHETNFFVRGEFFAANARKICVEVEIRKFAANSQRICSELFAAKK